jgi:hypothetical protein
MSRNTEHPFARFSVFVWFSPERGEFSGWCHIYNQLYTNPGHDVRIPGSSDPNVVYDQAAEEFAMWMEGMIQASRDALPLL